MIGDHPTAETPVIWKLFQRFPRSRNPMLSWKATLRLRSMPLREKLRLRVVVINALAKAMNDIKVSVL